jgi:cytochrome c-type biogenesis protein CcmF
VTAHVSVTGANGEDLGQMHPAKWFFRKHEQEPTTEVAIRRSFAEDLYIVMPAFEIADQTASVEVHINPLVNWVWFGFAILALGTAVALLPETALGFAVAARLPAHAATASMLILGLLLFPNLVLAQHVVAPNSQLQVFSSDVRQVARKLACWCGGCSHLPVGDCACGHCAMEKTKITTMLKEGKSEGDVLDLYIAQYGGQQILSEPRNEGAGRILWLVPYLAGLGGAFAVAIIAVRWSRRPAAAVPGGPTIDDPTLAARLDDELRDLD